MIRPLPTPALPAHPFFHTPDQRRALARQRFFDEGQRPTGLVPEAVIQSWSRCLQQRRRCSEPVAAEPLSALRLQSALRRSRALLAAAEADVPHLEALAASAACHALLTDGEGVVVYASPVGSAAGLMPQVAQVGLDISERCFGTTAPAVALHSGQPSTVQQDEHFFEGFRALRCAAAPIRDAGGRIAGVLNLSAEDHAFGFDAAMVASAYAVTIEHRLMRAGRGDAWVLQFQVHPDWLDTPLAALAGLSSEGELAWCNEAARRLLPEDADHIAPLLGLDPAALAQAGAAGQAHRATLPGGLPIWWRLRPAARAPAPAPTTRRPIAAETPEPRLSEQQRDAIARALKASRGNVSRAARMLGVSRGWIYRHQSAPELFHP